MRKSWTQRDAQLNETNLPSSRRSRINRSCAYYESQVEGLGKRFLHELNQAVLLIGETPQRWRVMEADMRRYLMPHFPFAIYYRSYPDHIRILAFKHHSHHPDYWRYRVE